jgi:hypothetical protein
MPELKPGFAGVPPENGVEPPSVADLAEQIKALKAANTVEAAPQRAAKRQVCAQEPVTATIRRREQEAGGERQRRGSEEKDRKAARG